jgi:ElaA protein
MNVICLPFSDLSSQQLYKVLQLRSEVFVVEQTCIYQDIDNKDNKVGVHHLMLMDGQNIVGYARLLPAGLSYESPSMGRILVAPTKRGTGLGKALIRYSIEATQSLWPNCTITIGAQSHLSKLYQSFGFIEISEHYLEDDILHVDMWLKSGVIN